MKAVGTLICGDHGIINSTENCLTCGKLKMNDSFQPQRLMQYSVGKLTQYIIIKETISQHNAIIKPEIAMINHND